MPETRRLNILLVTPSRIISKGLCSIFNEHSGFCVETILSSLSRENEVAVRNSAADIIIADTSVFDYSGRANIKEQLTELTDAFIIALATCPLQEEAIRQFDGMISIYDSPATIINKLRNASRNEKPYPATGKEELSNREKEILVCVAQGMLNKEIADRFCLSIHTVITHRKNISRKIGIKTVAGLTVYALLNNLIDTNSL